MQGNALKQLDKEQRAQTAAKLKIINVLPHTKSQTRDSEHQALSKVSLDDDR